ncbi:hypothetical protein HPB47_018785 [Ixodes persulcatus]|uniref:Uncharacterized protein n=1 Tax=Ixodes persulcatus TaxID=34615 RepID=A0AC60QME2_IXOPE|nr:hypothetical protein HPB47_018785 [Ixodes persulcatus]
MASAFLQPPPPFEPSDNPAIAREEWRAAFTIYEMAIEFTEKPDAARKALLLHVLGPGTRCIQQTFPEVNRSDSVAAILQQFDDLYMPYKSVTQAMAMFDTVVQQPGQTIDDFVTALKLQACKSEFGPQKNRLLSNRIIVSIRDDALQEQ